MTQAADQMRSKRQAFAAPGSKLDKAVRVLAIGLPALVGMIAAMMVITPLSPRGDVSFLLDRNKVAIADDRLRVDEAMYRGQDSDGRPFSLLAGQAVQQNKAVRMVQLDDLSARILLDEGPAVLNALAGTYDIESEQVSVPSLVQFTASDGYEMAARNVVIDLPSRTLLGRGGVSGEVPAGSFSANRIRADLSERTLLLSGNAKMTMVPGQLRVPSAMQ